MRATPSHFATSSTFGRRLAPWLFFKKNPAIWSNSPEATVAKCCKYALFLYKNAFFPKKICIFAFFVVPLHPLSKSNGPLAQLNRVPHYGCGGCRFESCTDHKQKKKSRKNSFLSVISFFCL